MNKEQIIEAIKEKVELPEGIAEKAAGLMDGKSLSGDSSKEGIIRILVEKLGIDEAKANEIYNAVAGFLTEGVVDKIKGLFGKN